MPTTASSSTQRRAMRPAVLLTLVLLATSAAILALYSNPPALAKGDDKPDPNRPIPVTAANVKQQAMPVWIDALGTVVPRNYVNVMPRVAGLLQSVNYREGQPVKAGQLLATIDPRPYRILVEQAQAQLMRDQAQLNGAKVDLVRYETLLKQDSISAQQVDVQRATVAQVKATVAADKATLDNAQLQLSWTRILAPTAGITGLRQVDAGNMVGTSGAIGGGNSAIGGTAASSTPIVTLAQVQPVAVTFSVAQNQLPAVIERMRGGAKLPVQAWDQRRTSQLASGSLIAVDNQINSATGSVTLKSEFANPDMTLFPNQFVNVRLLVNTLPNALVVPTTAIATGAPGSYVYVINSGKVSLRPVKTGVSDAANTIVNSGLQLGEQVVTDGLDRLRDGSKVKIVTPLNPNASPGKPPHQGHRAQGKPA